jgi:hypothetical protein
VSRKDIIRATTVGKSPRSAGFQTGFRFNAAAAVGKHKESMLICEIYRFLFAFSALFAIKPPFISIGP